MSLPAEHKIRRNGWAAGAVLTMLHLFVLPFLADRMDIAWFSASFLVLLGMAAWMGRLPGLLPVAYMFPVLNHLFDPATGMGFLPWAIPAVLFVLVWKSTLPLTLLFLLGGWMGLLGAAGIFAWVWQAGVVFFEFSRVQAFPLFLGICLLAALPVGAMMFLTGFLHRRLGWPAGLCGALVYAVVAHFSQPGLSLNISLALAPFPLLLQPADIVGVHGVTTLIAFVAGMAVAAAECHQRGSRRRAVWFAAVAGAGIAAHLGYGALAMQRHTVEPGGDAISVALIQPMAPLKILNQEAGLRAETARANIELSRAALERGGVNILFWPEGAGPFAAHTPDYNPEFMDGIAELQEEFPVPLAVQCIEFTTDPASGTISYYNVVTVIQPPGRAGDIYRKNILMPFGEYLPFEEQFPFLRRLFRQTRSMLPGERTAPLGGPGARFTPLICYEVLFPAYVREASAAEAGYMVNFTNDRWYGVRQQPRQHLAFAILRAVENRKPVVRPTNSGISAVIDRRGVIAREGWLPAGEAGVLHATIQPSEVVSLYSRIGNPLHPWILTPLLIGLLAYVCLPHSRTRRRGRQRPPEGAPGGSDPRPERRSRRRRRR